MDQPITLTCPTCGGKLQITNDVTRFACAYCGNEHTVKRAAGVVSIAPLINEVVRVRTGVDKTASELAIQRLYQELAACHLELEAISKSGNTCLATACATIMIVSGVISLLYYGKSMANGEFMTSLIPCIVSLGLIAVGVGLTYWIHKSKGVWQSSVDEIIQRKRRIEKEISYHQQLVSLEQG